MYAVEDGHHATATPYMQLRKPTTSCVYQCEQSLTVTCCHLMFHTSGTYPSQLSFTAACPEPAPLGGSFCTARRHVSKCIGGQHQIRWAFERMLVVPFSPCRRHTLHRCEHVCSPPPPTLQRLCRPAPPRLHQAVAAAAWIRNPAPPPPRPDLGPPPAARLPRGRASDLRRCRHRQGGIRIRIRIRIRWCLPQAGMDWIRCGAWLCRPDLGH